MARKKVSLQWISNNASRRATFTKRRQALIKKTSELATLCAVRICLLIYGENDARPVVWPSVPEAMALIASYKDTEDLHQWSKMTSHEDFLRTRLARLRHQVRKADYDSQGRETTILYNEAVAGLGTPGLAGVTNQEKDRLREVVDKKMKAAQERLKRLGINLGLVLRQPQQQQLPHARSSVIQPQVPYTSVTQVQAPVAPYTSATEMQAQLASVGGPQVQQQNVRFMDQQLVQVNSAINFTGINSNSAGPSSAGASYPYGRGSAGSSSAAASYIYGGGGAGPSSACTSCGGRGRLVQPYSTQGARQWNPSFPSML